MSDSDLPLLQPEIDLQLQEPLLAAGFCVDQLCLLWMLQGLVALLLPHVVCHGACVLACLQVS